MKKFSGQAGIVNEMMGRTTLAYPDWLKSLKGSPAWGQERLWQGLLHTPWRQ